MEDRKAPEPKSKRAYEFATANEYKLATGKDTFTQDAIKQFIDDLGKEGTRPRKLMEKMVGGALPYGVLADLSEASTESHTRSKNISEKFRKGEFVYENDKAVETTGKVNEMMTGLFEFENTVVSIPPAAARMEKDGILKAGKDDAVLAARDKALKKLMKRDYVAANKNGLYFGAGQAFHFNSMLTGSKDNLIAFEGKLKEWGAKEGADYYHRNGLSEAINIIGTVSCPTNAERIKNEMFLDIEKKYDFVYRNGVKAMESAEKAAAVGEEVGKHLKPTNVAKVVEEVMRYSDMMDVPQRLYGMEFAAFLNACGVTADMRGVPDAVRHIVGTFQAAPAKKGIA